MAQRITYNGQVHEFPDTFSQEQISAALKSYKAAPSPAPQAVQQSQPEKPYPPISALLGPASVIPKMTVEPVVEGFKAIKDRGELSPLTTTLGGYFGPLGSFAGSAVGQLSEQLVQGNSTPNLFGIAGNAAADAAIDWSLGKVSKVAGRGAGDYLAEYNAGNQSPLKTALLKNLFPIKNPDIDVAAGRAALDTFKPSVGQLTGSEFAKFMERGLAHKAALKSSKEQQKTVLGKVGELTQEFTGRKIPTPFTKLGEQGQEIVEKNRNLLRSRIKSSYDIVDSVKGQNTIGVEEVIGERPSNIINPATGKPDMIPITKTRRIAPIPLRDTLAISVLERQQLNDYFNESNLMNLPENLRSEYKAAKTIIDDAMTPIKVQQGGQTLPMALRDYDTLDQAQKAITKILNRKRDVDFTDSERMLLRLRDAMQRDIDSGIQKWPIRSGEARLALEEGRKLTKEKFDVYNERVMNKVRDREKQAYPSEFYSDAFQNRDAAKELMRALGPYEGEDNIRAAYFEKVMQDAWDPSGKSLYPEKIIRALEDPNSAGREILSSQQRAKLLQFSRAIKNLGEKETASGQVALRIREGGLFITGISGLLTSAQRGFLTTSVMTAGTGIGILLGGRVLAKALLDPKNAELATRLTKVKPNSPEAKFASKALLLAMKGQQVRLQIPNVGIFDAQVNEQGRIEMKQPD